LKEKLLGSDREGLGIGLGLGIIERRSQPDRRSEPNTVLLLFRFLLCHIVMAFLLTSL